MANSILIIVATSEKELIKLVITRTNLGYE